MLLLITYDLVQPEQQNRNYKPVYDAIQYCGYNNKDKYKRILESVWLVHTDITIEECYHIVKDAMLEGDELFIVDITNSNFIGWLQFKVRRWIKKHIPQTIITKLKLTRIFGRTQ